MVLWDTLQLCIISTSYIKVHQANTHTLVYTVIHDQHFLMACHLHTFFLHQSTLCPHTGTIIMHAYLYSLVPRANIENVGVAWGRGYTCTHKNKYTHNYIYDACIIYIIHVEHHRYIIGMILSNMPIQFKVALKCVGVSVRIG